jgi:peptidoglycan-associated lipoprotein
MTLRSSRTFVALGAALALAACGSSVKLNETPVEQRSPTPVAQPGMGSAAPGSGSATAPAGQSRVAPVAATTAAPGAVVGKIVYFDFDSFAIRDEFKSVIEGNAKVLLNTRGKRIVIEGHADERGSREYNLALGQKRAQAVLRSLALLGANEAQMEAVSFGEERPATTGHDEAAWAKNRRAELRDR